MAVQLHIKHIQLKKETKKIIKKIGKKVKKGKRGGEVEKKLTYKMYAETSSSQEIDVSQRKKMAEALQNIQTDRWTDRQTDRQTN